jgi:hypothetical protein
MKSFVVIAVLFFVFRAFGFEKCVQTIDPSEEISLERIVASEQLSFNDCPQSILLNQVYVRWLTNVKDISGASACTYGTLGTNITCYK